MATLSSIITPSNVLTATSTATLTNKTINGSNNTVTNIPLSTGVTGTLPVANGGTGLTTLGTAAQILSVNSGATALEYVTLPAAASGLVLLSTVTASNSATMDIETTFSSTYDAYLIVGTALVSANDDSEFSARLKIGGTYLTSAYLGHYQNIRDGSATYSGVGGNGGFIGISDGTGNGASESLNFTMKVFNPTSTTRQHIVVGDIVNVNQAPFYKGGAFIGGNTTTGALTGVRFFFGGNTVSGKIRLYGIANS